MTRRARGGLALAAALCWMTAAGPVAAQDVDDEGWLVEVGQKAPEYALPDVDGTVHRLSDLAGSPAVLLFWGSW